MLANTKQDVLLRQLITAPENALEYLDLIYVTNKHLNIKRAKQKDEFVYIKNGEIVKNKKHLARISKLVIPPAWASVKISSLTNGHLQATGRDKKHRKQYRYHEKWSRVRNQTKFYKMYYFGKALPKIRKKVEQDLNQQKFNKTKVLAIIIKLLEETHIRIGNQYYANRNETYGLSTLRSKHLNVFQNKIKFEFTGKRGKNHSVTLRNKRLIKLVNQCEEIPGWELFKYYDDNGIKHPVDSTMVNKYLQDISSDYFTAKDFRTWSASLICLETLINFEPTTSVKTKDKNILNAIDTAAKALGNTRKVARKYYIHPLVINAYKNDGFQDVSYILKHETTKSSKFMSTTETALLQLIKNFNLKNALHLQ